MQTRNTLQRRLVLEAVQSLHHHPTAEDIYLHGSQSHPGISRGTVYRNLGLLADTGAIQRVSHLNAADRFDFELKPHYHFRCTECDGVFDVELPYQQNLMSQVQNSKGFVFEDYQLSFTGLCPTCAQNRKGKQA